jgi:hypothetical protein
VIFFVPFTDGEDSRQGCLNPLTFLEPLADVTFALRSSSTSFALFSRASFSRWAFDRNLGYKEPS